LLDLLEPPTEAILEGQIEEDGSRSSKKHPLLRRKLLHRKLKEAS